MLHSPSLWRSVWSQISTGNTFLWCASIYIERKKVRRKPNLKAALNNIFVFTKGQTTVTWKVSLVGLFLNQFCDNVWKQEEKDHTRDFFEGSVIISVLLREVISFTLLFPSSAYFWPLWSISCLVWKDGTLSEETVRIPCQPTINFRLHLTTFVTLSGLLHHDNGK